MDPNMVFLFLLPYNTDSVIPVPTVWLGGTKIHFSGLKVNLLLYREIGKKAVAQYAFVLFLLPVMPSLEKYRFFTSERIFTKISKNLVPQDLPHYIVTTQM
jgi:hypothetical protein